MDDRYKHSINVEVRYSELDPMGIVHHKNYWSWLEIARIKWLHKHNFSYGQLEKSGIFLPVIKAEISYFKPLKIDYYLTIHYQLKRPTFSQIAFQYNIFHQQQLMSSATTRHVFINKQGQAVKIPPQLKKILPIVSSTF